MKKLTLLAALIFTGCAVEGVVEGAMDEAVPIPPHPVEVHKPHAPRELRTHATSRGPLRYEVVEGQAILEGDMIMGPVAEFEAELDRGSLKAFGVTSDDGRWSMPVKYSFADSVDGATRGHIETALARLVNQSGALISFSQCSGLCAGNHLKFKYESGGGCSADIGRLGWPLVNKVNLDNHCDGRDASGYSYDSEIGSLMHEVMHALGVHHEQGRCDRDNFVSIQWQNIQGGEAHNFDQHCSNATDYGYYDYGSIMHYPSHGFSNGNGPTIIALDPNNGWRMGNRQALSHGDMVALKSIYGIKCTPSRDYCNPWDCGYVDVGCGVKLACGPCQPCEGSYCSDGSCCPSTGMCSDGLACPL